MLLNQRGRFFLAMCVGKVTSELRARFEGGRHFFKLATLAEPYIRATLFLKWYVVWLQQLFIYRISNLGKVPNHCFNLIAPFEQELVDVCLE